MLRGSFESVGINKEQAEAFNDGINKIAMLQNMLHVVSNLPIGDNGFKGGNSINVICSDKLINLFTDMEEMASDAVIIYDEFEITPPTIDNNTDLLLNAIRGFKESEISEVLICADIIKERKVHPIGVLNKNQNN